MSPATRRSVGKATAAALLAAAVAFTIDTARPDDSIQSMLFFDGVCNLCDGFVNFVADRDAQKRVKFGAQQKHMQLLARINAPTDLSTLVLVQGDKFYLYSSAALRTLAAMDWPWKGLAAFLLVPFPIRDFVYKVVAKHRYKIFGKVETCRVPTGDFRKRFIDYRPEEEEGDPITRMTGE